MRKYATLRGRLEMDFQTFLSVYPKRADDSDKTKNGRILLVAGSYGMAGACSLAQIGAHCAGASYIHVSVPESIYPIVACQDITSVYHPGDGLPEGLTSHVDAVGIGCGLTNHPRKRELLRQVLAEASVPVVLDAEALRMVAADPDLISSARCPLILTPHLGELSAITGMDTDTLRKDPAAAGKEYAVRHHLTLVVKGHPSYTISPDGEICVNTSGNAALAQAGSGDVLTGIVTAMCAVSHADPFTAACAAVWFHGALADEAVKGNSTAVFDLRSLPQTANRMLAGYR